MQTSSEISHLKIVKIPETNGISGS